MYTIKLPKILQPFSCSDIIRLGKPNDGGYLVNELDIAKTKKLISFGVGHDWSFEKEFLTKNNCSLIAYDSSLLGNIDLENSYYEEFFSGQNVHIKKNIGNQSDQIRCSDALSDSDFIFLKCDIEGNEYEILDEILLNQNRLSGLIIEFHNINNFDNFNSITNFIAKINLKLLHMHINNYFYYKHGENEAIPDICEMTFTSSSNIYYDSSLVLPNYLDMPNNPESSDFKVVF